MAVIDVSEKNLAVSTAEEAAWLTADACQAAKGKGTFGVGALLIDNHTKQVLAVSHNEVLRDGVVQDPTAHAERQIIDWYYEQQSSGKTLPKPENLTIVSSLDP